MNAHHHPPHPPCSSPSSSSLPSTASALARSSARATAATALLALLALRAEGVGGRDLLLLAGVALPARPLLDAAGLAALPPRPAGPCATGGAAPPRMAGLRATGGAAPPRIAGLRATGEPALPRMAGLSTPAGLAGGALLVCCAVASWTELPELLPLVVVASAAAGGSRAGTGAPPAPRRWQSRTYTAAHRCVTSAPLLLSASLLPLPARIGSAAYASRRVPASGRARASRNTGDSAAVPFCSPCAGHTCAATKQAPASCCASPSLPAAPPVCSPGSRSAAANSCASGTGPPLLLLPPATPTCGKVRVRQQHEGNHKCLPCL